MTRRTVRWWLAALVALQLGPLPALGAAAAAEGSAAPEPTEGKGLLRIVLFRPGTIWLDGVPAIDMTGAGTRAPRPWQDIVMQSAELPAGTHRLMLRPLDPRLVPPFDEVTVELAAGDTVDVPLGRPLLVTSPPGAHVGLDGVEIGLTPLRLDPRRLPGTTLFIESRGCLRVMLTGDSLLARARESGALRLELSPLPGAVAMGRSDPARRRFFGFSRWQGIGISTALLAGGVVSAITLKNVADDRYQVYRHTGDPALQKRNYDSAQRYDRLSLIGWGVAEAAFLTAFFLIIQEEPKGLVPTASAGRDAVTGEPAWHVGVRRAF